MKLQQFLDGVDRCISVSALTNKQCLTDKRCGRGSPSTEIPTERFAVTPLTAVRIRWPITPVHALINQKTTYSRVDVVFLLGGATVVYPLDYHLQFLSRHDRKYFQPVLDGRQCVSLIVHPFLHQVQLVIEWHI